MQSVNVTPAYLFRKVGDPEGRPTILYDEIDTVFGARARENEEIRGLLNAGHRKHSTAGRCVVRGKTIETEDIQNDQGVPFQIFYGISDNPHAFWSIVNARRVIGYQPQDSSERRFADLIARHLAAAAEGERTSGGS